MHRHVVDISALIKNKPLALIIEKDFLVAIAGMFNADGRSCEVKISQHGFLHSAEQLLSTAA